MFLLNKASFHHILLLNFSILALVIKMVNLPYWSFSAHWGNWGYKHFVSQLFSSGESLGTSCPLILLFMPYLFFLPPPSGTFKYFSDIFKTFLTSVYIPLSIYCLILRFILHGRLLNHFFRIFQFLVSFLSRINIMSSNGSRNFTSFIKWHQNNIKSLFWQGKYEFRNMSIPFKKGTSFWWRGSEEAISWLFVYSGAVQWIASAPEYL